MKQGILPAALLLVVIGGPVNADDRQARINYMLNCQGCHTPDGSGAPGKVPSLKNFMGNFVQVEGGREFLIQVPGAAQSTLSDAELAERKKKWKPRKPSITTGYLGKYAAMATSADTGAILKCD